VPAGLQRSEAFYVCAECDEVCRPAVGLGVRCVLCVLGHDLGAWMVPVHGGYGLFSSEDGLGCL
jgi:hypothetical protein